MLKSSACFCIFAICYKEKWRKNASAYPLDRFSFSSTDFFVSPWVAIDLIHFPPNTVKKHILQSFKKCLDFSSRVSQRQWIGRLRALQQSKRSTTALEETLRTDQVYSLIQAGGGNGRRDKIFTIDLLLWTTDVDGETVALQPVVRNNNSSSTNGGSNTHL